MSVYRNVVTVFYLRRGGYIFIGVCLFVCRQDVGADFGFVVPGKVQMDCKSGSMKKILRTGYKYVHNLLKIYNSPVMQHFKV